MESTSKADTMKKTILFMMLLSPVVFAGFKKSTSGASIDPHDFFSCMEKSVQGDNEGKCVNNGEANQCVGVKRALEDYTKNTKCFQKNNGICLTYGHLQNTQMQWLSTAAGHLAVFHLCVSDRFGASDEKDLSPALNDQNFLNFLRKVDDGSGALGLPNGSVLKRSLQGEKLGTIIASSPEGKKIPSKDIDSMKDSANNPIVIDLETVEKIGGSNPASEGESWGVLRTAFIEGVEEAESNARVFSPKVIEAKKIEESRTPAATVARNPNIFYRTYKSNPYSLGLDTNLFERVSNTYQKQFRSLQGIDDYVRSDLKAPQDIKSFIQKGGAIEL